MQCEMRHKTIEGIGPWLWRAGDFWGWQHPANEFPALRDLVLKHAKERRVIIQAGGCLGMYPRLWAEHFERVFTFEPDPDNFYCLSHNCRQASIIKAQLALFDEPGVYAFEPGNELNAGLGKIRENGTSKVAAIPVDYLNLPVVDVIQLDCEDAEEEVIRGARATIERCRPIVAIEQPSYFLRSMMRELEYVPAGRCGSMPDVLFIPRA